MLALLYCQADAESIISAAFGSHKELRYQDFLKFFLPEASSDMGRDKALSLKALDSNDLSPCKSRIPMQVNYDLEGQKSLANYLEDSNIRLIRAECPNVQTRPDRKCEYRCRISEICRSMIGSDSVTLIVCLLQVSLPAFQFEWLASSKTRSPT